MKLDLSAMYDKAETEGAGAKVPSSGGEVTEALALREASVEAINKAMYHDIYNVSQFVPTRPSQVTAYC